MSTTGTVRKYNYDDNSFSNGMSGANMAITVDTDNNLYAMRGITLGAAVANTSIYYAKNNANTFHRAIRNQFQIGTVISANAYSTFGIYTVIPYSRQRLTNAWHLVIRTDGAIYMEVI